MLNTRRNKNQRLWLAAASLSRGDGRAAIALSAAGKYEHVAVPQVQREKTAAPVRPAARGSNPPRPPSVVELSSSDDSPYQPASVGYLVDFPSSDDTQYQPAILAALQAGGVDIPSIIDGDEDEDEDERIPSPKSTPEPMSRSSPVFNLPVSGRIPANSPISAPVAAAGARGDDEDSDDSSELADGDGQADESMSASETSQLGEEYTNTPAAVYAFMIGRGPAPPTMASFLLIVSGDDIELWNIIEKLLVNRQGNRATDLDADVMAALAHLISKKRRPIPDEWVGRAVDILTHVLRSSEADHEWRIPPRVLILLLMLRYDTTLTMDDRWPADLPQKIADGTAEYQEVNQFSVVIADLLMRANPTHPVPEIYKKTFKAPKLTARRGKASKPVAPSETDNAAQPVTAIEKVMTSVDVRDLAKIFLQNQRFVHLDATMEFSSKELITLDRLEAAMLNRMSNNILEPGLKITNIRAILDPVKIDNLLKKFEGNPTYYWHAVIVQAQAVRLLLVRYEKWDAAAELLRTGVPRIAHGRDVPDAQSWKDIVQNFNNAKWQYADTGYGRWADNPLFQKYAADVAAWYLGGSLDRVALASAALMADLDLGADSAPTTAQADIDEVVRRLDVIEHDLGLKISLPVVTRAVVLAGVRREFGLWLAAARRAEGLTQTADKDDVYQVATELLKHTEAIRAALSRSADAGAVTTDVDGKLERKNEPLLWKCALLLFKRAIEGERTPLGALLDSMRVPSVNPAEWDEFARVYMYLPGKYNELHQYMNFSERYAYPFAPPPSFASYLPSETAAKLYVAMAQLVDGNKPHVPLDPDNRGASTIIIDSMYAAILDEIVSFTSCDTGTRGDALKDAEDVTVRSIVENEAARQATTYREFILAMDE